MTRRLRLYLTVPQSRVIDLYLCLGLLRSLVTCRLGLRYAVMTRRVVSIDYNALDAVFRDGRNARNTMTWRLPRV